MKISQLEKVIGYKFNDVKLIEKALSHSSYANEKNTESNERLEFLGDSILNFTAAEFLCKKYREVDEGELSKMRASLVCEQALCIYAKDISLTDAILLGKGETQSIRRKDAITADAFEAVIAAIYLDGGIEKAKAFILPYLEKYVDMAASGKVNKDNKTVLQEIIQQNKGEKLSYKITGETGPAHDRTFYCEVLLNSNVIGRGEGKSKKEAEQEAARAALALMGL
jgi:ribonuclease-3